MIKNFDQNMQKTKMYNSHHISLDWKKKYPLDVKDERITPKKEDKTYIWLYKTIKNIIKKINRKVRDYTPFKIKFVEFSNYINKITGKNSFVNLDGCIRFDNGYLGYVVPDKGSFEKDGERTIEFAQYIEKQGIKFAYILCPSKFSKYKKELPNGIIDYSNENADSFLNVLYNNNIPVLDLRKDLNKEYPNHFDAFFKTDHHWKPETGFWATKEIINFLNKNFDQKLDKNIIQRNNFTFSIHPKLFLGSQGKKLSLTLVEPEDFTVIKPSFQTDFQFNYGSLEKKGSFENSLLDKSKLVKDYYNINTYFTYLGFDTPIVRIKNRSNRMNTKILIIHDSYIAVIAPFLAITTQELILVDLRPPRGFNGSIKKFINKEKPDVVLILYNAGQFSPNLETRPFLHTFY